jgi:hypothetical protein
MRASKVAWQIIVTLFNFSPHVAKQVTAATTALILPASFDKHETHGDLHTASSICPLKSREVRSDERGGQAPKLHSIHFETVSEMKCIFPVSLCYATDFSRNKLAQAVTLVTCIREVLASNLGRNIDYPGCGFSSFLRSLQKNSWTVNWNRPPPFPSTSPPIHYSGIQRYIVWVTDSHWHHQIFPWGGGGNKPQNFLKKIHLNRLRQILLFALGIWDRRTDFSNIILIFGGNIR